MLAYNSAPSVCYMCSLLLPMNRTPWLRCFSPHSSYITQIIHLRKQWRSRPVSSSLLLPMHMISTPIYVLHTCCLHITKEHIHAQSNGTLLVTAPLKGTQPTDLEVFVPGCIFRYGYHVGVATILRAERGPQLTVCGSSFRA